MVALPVDSAFASAIRLQRETDQLIGIQIDVHRKAVDQARYWDRIGGSNVAAGANALAAIAGGAERERGDIARFLEASDAVRRAGIGRFADVSALAAVKSEIAGGVHASEMLKLASHSADVARARDQFAGDGLTRTAAQAMGATVSDMFKDATGMTGVSAGLRDIMGMEATRADAQCRALIGNIPSGLDATLASIRDASAAFQSRADAYAAYGPFVHIHREPTYDFWHTPARDRWREETRQDVWESTDEEDDEYEKTVGGVFVAKKRRRPPGIRDYSAMQVMSAIVKFAKRAGRIPTQKELAKRLNRNPRTIQRYCDAYNIDWHTLPYTLSLQGIIIN